MINTVIQGDCLEVMKQIPDKSIDLVLTDPPYPINTNNGTNRFTENGWFQGSSDTYGEEWYLWFEDICRELKRILKSGRHFYCFVDEKNLFLLKPHIDKYFEFKKVIVWHKQNMGLGYHYRNILEYCFLYSSGKSFQLINTEPNFYMAPKDGIEGHPTVKPNKMFRWLIENSALPNGVVLDPFAGSGTTAIACIKTNRNYICIEKEPKYVDIINKRIENELSQMKLAI